MQHAVLTSGEAWALWQEWMALPEVSFLNEPVGLDEQLGQFSRRMSIRPQAVDGRVSGGFCDGGQSSHCHVGWRFSGVFWVESAVA